MDLMYAMYTSQNSWEVKKEYIQVMCPVDLPRGIVLKTIISVLSFNGSKGVDLCANTGPVEDSDGVVRWEPKKGTKLASSPSPSRVTNKPSSSPSVPSRTAGVSPRPPVIATPAQQSVSPVSSWSPQKTNRKPTSLWDHHQPEPEPKPEPEQEQESKPTTGTTTTTSATTTSVGWSSRSKELRPTTVGSLWGGEETETANDTPWSVVQVVEIQQEPSTATTTTQKRWKVEEDYDEIDTTADAVPFGNGDVPFWEILDQQQATDDPKPFWELLDEQQQQEPKPYWELLEQQKETDDPKPFWELQ
eukprot:TRINITY_DN3695_c0_g1_i6.p1 TRINITY_DN3695_c0_g1~~TRINITY_DN3695_c0_g1_i6.p1  ORF type:complete len:303 (+),score=103.52 TRINITY_DN3695_c0_g1_i6:332-1240(+)